MIKRIAPILSDGARDMGIPLPLNAPAQFEKYYSFLEESGSAVNLTAITGAVEVVRYHFLDSLAVAKAARLKDMRVIDVGSGAGFPGVPLKIIEPSIRLTLLEANGKRVTFLRDLCQKLCIDVDCVNARAEEAAMLPDFRERYDIAVSRAVARLNVLSELCLPFVCVGGMFVAMKTAGPTDELSEALGAIALLGAELHECVEYTIPETEVRHTAILIRKTTATPSKYPRRFAKIRRAPL